MRFVNLGTGYMVDLTNERTLLKLDIQYVIRTVNIGSVTSFKQNELRFTLGWPEYTSMYFCLLVQESSCCHNIIQTFLQLRSVKIVQVIFFFVSMSISVNMEQYLITNFTLGV